MNIKATTKLKITSDKEVCYCTLDDLVSNIWFRLFTPLSKKSFKEVLRKDITIEI